jgi:hypothetical protein
MTAPTIRIGSGPSAYTFEVPVDFSPRVETIRGDTGGRIGEKRVWPVRGMLVGATPENVAALWDALAEALASEDVSCYFIHDGAVLEQLDASEAEAGPRFDNLAVRKNSECAWNSRLEFDFEIEAEFYDAEGDVIDSSERTTYRELADGTLLRAMEGKLRVRKGSSARAAAEQLLPDAPAGFRLAESSVTTDADDLNADYKWAFVSVRGVIPIGVRIAERCEKCEESGGARRVTYRAEFTGEGAERAAERYLDEARNPVLERRISKSADGAKVEVVYITLEPVGAGEKISFYETIEISGGGREITEFPVDGAAPLIMKGARRALVVRQRGASVHRGEVPPEREPLKIPGLVRKTAQNAVGVGELTFDAKAGTVERRWDFEFLAAGEDAERRVNAAVGRIAE